LKIFLIDKNTHIMKKIYYISGFLLSAVMAVFSAIFQGITIKDDWAIVTLLLGFVFYGLLFSFFIAIIHVFLKKRMSK